MPNLAPPLSPSTLLPLLSALSTTPPTPLDISALVVVPFSPSPSPSSPPLAPASGPVQVTIPLQPTGLLLYLSQAHYESGSTPLVSWVPCRDQFAEPRQPGGGDLGEQAEGVARMAQLVAEWQQVGTPRVATAAAPTNASTGEIVMSG